MAKKDEKQVEKEPEFSYARVPETPEEAARVPDILNHWHDMEKSNPLPLEWLVESLKAGKILDPPEGR